MKNIKIKEIEKLKVKLMQIIIININKKIEKDIGKILINITKNESFFMIFLFFLLFACLGINHS